MNSQMAPAEIEHVVADSGASLVVRSSDDVASDDGFGPAVPADAKDVAVRSRLGLSPEDYYRALTAIIDQPGALAHDPLLVRRLRRQRLMRQRQRQAERLGRLGDPAGG